MRQKKRRCTFSCTMNMKHVICQIKNITFLKPFYAMKVHCFINNPIKFGSQPDNTKMAPQMKDKFVLCCIMGRYHKF